MSKAKLSRRTVIRGAGTIAIALPWLEAMQPTPSARAAGDSQAKRFVAVYQPGGSVMDRFRTGPGFELSPILSPLETMKDCLIVPRGLNMDSAIGEQHQAGIIAFLTGHAQRQPGTYVDAPSLDQVIARTASAGKPRNSIEMAVRWATGKSRGLLDPINSVNFADDANHSPIPPRIDPQEIFQSLFGDLDPGGTGMSEALSRKQSILDFVGRRYETVSRRLGGADRARLEEHLTRIRALEQSLGALQEIDAARCTPPARVDTSDYNPSTGLNSDDVGGILDLSSDAAIPKVGQFMMDMLVMALACDLTGVATLQWTDTEAKHTFPWLGLSEHHHYYQHDGGFRPDECEQIGIWYAQQHAYLLERMQAVDMGGHTLLDESVVFIGSELADPPSHSKSDMPFILAGGGGLKGGQAPDFGGRSHNDLLASIRRLFDASAPDTFGETEFTNSALTGLT